MVNSSKLKEEPHMIKKILDSLRPYFIEDTILLELKDKTIRVQPVDDEKDQLSWKTGMILMLISTGICFFLAYSADKASAQNNVNASETYTQVEASATADDEVIQYDDTGAYLQKDGTKISDYYPIIEEDYKKDAFRVIGSNGLYGFINKDTGTEQNAPCFQKAAPMEYGSACVSKDGKNYYFIDKNGNRMTGDYEDAYPWESQGQYARVKKSDGWAVINKKDVTLLDKCTVINPLPEITTIGTALRDNVGLVFRIEMDKEPEEISIIAEIPNILEISELHYDNFAVIKSENGYGVVSAGGNTIIDPVYKKVDWEAFPFEDGSYGRKLIFKCQADDGHYEIIKWDPREC